MLPVVHPVVDGGVDAGVGHCQPVEGQVHVLHVGAHGQRRHVVRVDEVRVVRQPAACENRYHDKQHSDNLRRKHILTFQIMFLVLNIYSQGFENFHIEPMLIGDINNIHIFVG